MLKRKQREEEPEITALESLGLGENRYVWLEEPDEETRDKREAEISASLSWSL